MDPRKELLEAKLKSVERLSSEVVDLAKTNRRGLLLISQKLTQVKKLIDQMEGRVPVSLDLNSPIDITYLVDKIGEHYKIYPGSFTTTYGGFLKEVEEQKGEETLAYFITELLTKGEVTLGVKKFSLPIK